MVIVVMASSNHESDGVEEEVIEEEIVEDEELMEEEEIVVDEVTDDEKQMEVEHDGDDDDVIVVEEYQDDYGQNEAFYYDEETVAEDETVGGFDEESVYEEEFVTADMSTSRRTILMPLDEDHEVVEITDEIIEEEYHEEEGETELEGEDADDESSAWIDDGRDYTKDPNAVVPRSFHFRDHFADDSGDDNLKEEDDDDDEGAFYLDVPEIESVSSLEELSGAEDSQASSIIMEEIIEEGESSKRKLSERQTLESSLRKSNNSFNQSVDWDHDGPFTFGEDDSGDDLMSSGSIQVEVQEVLDVKDASTAPSRKGLSLKRQRQEPPRFCGRHPELELLRAALTALDHPDPQNPRRLAWIYGSSGIGKTALIEEFLLKNVTLSQVNKYIVGRGSFDEKSSQTQKPYSALVDSLMDVVDHLLIDCTGADVSWRDRIGAGLGKEAKLLTMLIPNITSLLEFEEDTHEFENTFELATGRLLDRLRFALRRFLRIVCRYQKVVLFLDDLQWADEDSLRMIDTLLSTYGLTNFFFIGCHRGVKRTHALPIIKTKLASLSAVDIMMKPLDKKDTEEIMASILESEGAKVDMVATETLALWIKEKSSGDPFFLCQLVRYLVDHEKLDKSEGQWKCDTKKLKRDTTIPTTAVDFVSERIKKMNAEAQLILKSAAFLGQRDFHLQSLYRAVQTCSLAEGKDGECPVKDITSLADFLENCIESGMIAESTSGNYKFTHEIIMRAAALLLPISNAKNPSMHLEFALQLHKEANSLSKSASEKESMLILVAYHYSFATENLKDPEDCEKVARLNLSLAESAIRKASFSTAVHRIGCGLSFLDQKSRWKNYYDLTLKLHLELSRVRFCMGDYDAAKILADVLLINSKEERDKIGTYELLIWLAVVRDQLEEAFRLVNLALKEIWDESPNEEVESEVAIIRETLKSKPDAELLMLPEITHNKASSKLVFLARLAEIAWMRQDFLNQDLAALKMVDLTIRYGSSKVSSLAFALYGICLARRNLHKEAYRYGHLAEMTATADSPFGAQAITFHHYAIAYWRRPFQASLEPLRKSAMVALESNDIENLSFRVGTFISHVLATGSILNSADELFRQFKEYAVAFRGRSTWLATIPFRLMLKLRGEPLDPAERGFEKYADARAMQYLIFFQMIHAVYMQDLVIAEKLSNKLVLKPEGVWLPIRGFMEGLIATSLARASFGKIRVRHHRKAAKIVEVLSGWAKNGLKQAYHMANLVNAELRFLSIPDMKSTDASALYDNAIASAQKVGFINHEALANERAGITFFTLQEDAIATRYLTRACELYKAWGAHAKVEQIKSKFPRHLDLPELQNIKSANDFDPFSIAGQQPGPTLDFGESQIFHFASEELLSHPPGMVSSPRLSRVAASRGRLVKPLQKTGRGTPLVRVPSAGRGKGRGIVRLRSRAGRGVGRGTPGLGTPGRGISSASQQSQTRAPAADLKQKQADKVGGGIVMQRQQSTPSAEQAQEPEGEDKATESLTGRQAAIHEKDMVGNSAAENPPVNRKPLHSNGAAVEDKVSLDVKEDEQIEKVESGSKDDAGDLSDEDPIRPSSDGSDLGVQSDHGPRYKEQTKEKKKKKRRKLKSTSTKPKTGKDDFSDEDSEDDEPVRRPRSLYSGLDVQSDHGPSTCKSKPRKMKSKSSNPKKKKKEKKESSKAKPKSSSKMVLDGDTQEATKRKSKAKVAEDEEKRLKRTSRSQSVEGEGSPSIVVDRKVPSRSKSDGSILVSSQRTEPDAENDSKLEGASDHSKKKIGRSTSLGGKLVKKLTSKLKVEKKAEVPAHLDRVEEVVEPYSNENVPEEGGKVARAKIQSSDHSKEKGDDNEKAEAKAKKSTPSRGGLMKTLSWTGKRKKKSKEAADANENEEDDSDIEPLERKSKSFSLGGDSEGKKLPKLKRGKKTDVVAGKNKSADADDFDGKSHPAHRSKSFSMDSESKGKKLSKLKKGKKPDLQTKDSDAATDTKDDAAKVGGVVDQEEMNSSEKPPAMQEAVDGARKGSAKTSEVVKKKVKSTLHSSDRSKEDESIQEIAEANSKKSTPRRGGLMKSLSWSGRRKKKAKGDAADASDEDAEDDSCDIKPPVHRSFSLGIENKGKKLSKLKRGKKEDIASAQSTSELKKPKKSLLSKLKRNSTKKSTTDEEQK